MVGTVLLLNGVTEDTDGEAVFGDGSAKNLQVNSTDFGGGTVSIQGSLDSGTTWITLLKDDGNPASFTSNAFFGIRQFNPTVLVRAVLDGATDPDPVYVRMG